MKPCLVDQIANAVLYEGYILYPYRASSRKNQQRFTFGRVYPEAYATAQQGAEACHMQTQCLLRSTTQHLAVRVRVRFLQPIAREVGRLPTPLSAWSEEAKASLEYVPDLCVDAQIYQTWQEAAEREIDLEWQSVTAAGGGRPFRIPGGEDFEPVFQASGHVVGAVRRRREELIGNVEFNVMRLDSDVFRLSVCIQNQTPVPEAALADPQALLLRTLASTHTIFQVECGQFISLLDPSPAYAAAAAQCHNIGTWPVLVGDQERQECATMLSSPIILYDYPRLAPESPGELCDGTEIDELLSLRIQALSDEEKWEMRQVDAFARRILERTERLSPAQFEGMHGMMHPSSVLEEEIFGRTSRLEQICVGGVSLRAGDRVRICPKGRADIMDLALAGKAAVIETIEQDADERVYLALVVEEDPGNDLGFLRQPGHRFFFAPEEVEPWQDPGL